MPKFTKIEWTNGTVNPTSGCDGCEIFAECYAHQAHVNRLAQAFPENYAADFREVRLIPGRVREAAKWGPLTEAEIRGKPWFRGKPRHVFISDMSDALSEAVPFDYLRREIVEPVSSEEGRRHVWQWLTKRPERMARFDQWLAEQGIAWPENLWAGTSLTTQPTAERRVPQLMQVRAAVRFLSCEPLRGPLDLARGLAGIHWVIGGGESGPAAGSTPLAWVRRLRDQAKAAGAAFFWKQWGEFVPGTQFVKSERLREIFNNPEACWRLGKAETGRLLDGREWNELPS